MKMDERSTPNRKRRHRLLLNADVAAPGIFTSVQPAIGGAARQG